MPCCKKGLLQQVGSPRDLYEQPANLFVAGFIGSPPMNLVPATLDGRTLKLPFVEFDLPPETAQRAEGHDMLIAGIRPEFFEDASLVSGDKLDKGVTFNADIDVIEWLGSEQFAYVPFEAPDEVKRRLGELEQELDSEQLRTQLVVALDAASRLSEGENAEIWLDPSRLHLFDPDSGENLTLQLEEQAEPADKVTESAGARAGANGAGSG